MVSLDEAIVVKLKSHGHNFELFVDPDLALDYRNGECAEPLDKILAVETVFKDASATDKASDDVMDEVFGTHQLQEVADTILKKGELHLTTEQKKRMLQERHKQIVSIITRNAINPQTNGPHPPARIEKAMEEARVEVSLHKSAKEQVAGVVKSLQPLLPIRIEKIKVAVKIPGTYAGKTYNILREFGDVMKEEWAASDMITLMEIPGGVQEDLLSKLNNLTHGAAEIKIVR